MVPKVVAATLLLGAVTAGTAASKSWQGDAQTLLTKVLRGIGDVASAQASMSLDGPVDWQEPTFSSRKPAVLTNVYESGSVSIPGGTFNAEIQYLTLFCVCDDATCSVQVAADLNGVVQVDRGDFVGYSPLFLLDEAGSKVPCLSLVEKDLPQLKFQGCDLVNASAAFNVHNCEGGDLTTFGVIQDESMIARPYSNYELLPDDISDSYDPTQTLGEVFGNVDVGELFLNLNTEVTIAGIDIPISMQEDIGPLLSQAGGVLAIGFINSVVSTFLPRTFNATSPASQATVADAYRILLAFSNLRLFRLVAPFKDVARTTISGDAVYGDILATQPDLIPLPEILSGITLLMLVASGFGYAVATNRLLSVPVVGALLVLATECSSYAIRLVGSIGLEKWGGTMLLVNTRASSRNYGLPLGGGLDGSALAVTVAYVQLSNASSSYLWLQYVGASLAVLGFFGGIYWGRRSIGNHEAPTGVVNDTQVFEHEVGDRITFNGLPHHSADGIREQASGANGYRNEGASIELQTLHHQ